MAARRGNAWTMLSRQLLAEAADRNGGVPKCELRLLGCTGRATSIDHIVPIIERPDLEYVRSNLQPACKHCNSRKEIQRRHRPERRKW